jgi:hypothetical protein
MQLAANVVPFPEPPAKTIPVDAAGPFTFPVWAATDPLSGDALNTIYREELVLVDPDAALEDDCLVIFQLAKCRPRMGCWWRTGRDHNGRFVPAGDPRECFSLGFVRYSAGEGLHFVRILGRVVGVPRRF